MAAIAALAAAPAAHATTVGATLTRRSFAPLVGDDFVFESNPLEQVNARLVQIEALAHSAPAQDPEGAFRLVFETQPGARPEHVCREPSAARALRHVRAPERCRGKIRRGGVQPLVTRAEVPGLAVRARGRPGSYDAPVASRAQSRIISR
jgi:hypothetical protein